MSYTVWLLHWWMFTSKKLNTVVLEIIVNDNLVVSCYTNSHLLDFTSYSLATLFGDSWDVAFCTCILKTQMISIFDPNILQLIKYWTLRSTSKNSWFLSCDCLLWISKIIIFNIWLRSISFLVCKLSDTNKDLLNRFKRYFGLSNICSIQAIYAIGSENSTL